MVLDEMEIDALTELANMGVGRSATNLSRMVSEPVAMSVPAVEVVPRTKAANLLESRGQGGVVAVSQDFSGEFRGRALLIFPEAQSLELVRAVVGDEVSSEEIVDLEHEALTEVGNIILNGCLATIGNVLRTGVKMSLPTILRGSGGEILHVVQPDTPAVEEQQVLFLYIDFSLQRRNLKGYIAILMDLPSLSALKALLQDTIKRLS